MAENRPQSVFVGKVARPTDAMANQGPTFRTHFNSRKRWRPVALRSRSRFLEEALYWTWRFVTKVGPGIRWNDSLPRSRVTFSYRFGRGAVRAKTPAMITKAGSIATRDPTCGSAFCCEAEREDCLTSRYFRCYSRLTTRLPDGSSRPSNPCAANPMAIGNSVSPMMPRPIQTFGRRFDVTSDLIPGSE